MQTQTSDGIRQLVRKHYGQIAARHPGGCQTGTTRGCCAPKRNEAGCGGNAIGYSAADLSGDAATANLNLGCGNPLAIGRLQPGETVLDLGSGAGFDCFLAAEKVGPQGRVIGVDMTPEMISKARQNADTVKAANVSFRLAEIEHLPVADASVDTIISNCVINLSPDKPKIWKEAYRVLRPGGRLAIADVVATADLPATLRAQAQLLTGCVAGAENVSRIEEQLQAVGFEEIRIRIRPGSEELIQQWLPDSGAEAYVASANIEARKPL